MDNRAMRGRGLLDRAAVYLGLRDPPVGEKGDEPDTWYWVRMVLILVTALLVPKALGLDGWAEFLTSVGVVVFLALIVPRRG